MAKDTYPVYFCGGDVSRERIGEFDPKSYNKVVEQIRQNMAIGLDSYDRRFNSSYVTKPPNSVAKSFSFNGAVKIPKDIEQESLSKTERELLKSGLFTQYRGSYYSRVNGYNEYEGSHIKEKESVYFIKLITKINFTYTQIYEYQEEFKNEASINFTQWQILFALFDNYNLYISQLFNLISHIQVLGNSKENSEELVVIKSYYYELTQNINKLIKGNPICEIPRLNLNLQNVFQT